jgi:hypothetical protein
VPNKTKTAKIQQRLADVAAQSGMLLMATAATIGMLELQEHPGDKRVAVPHQPSFAFAGETSHTGNDSQRREREEVGPHYVSYSVAQRTPGRAGRA